jgi:histone H3/H4
MTNKTWKEAIEDNLKYYSVQKAGKINKPVKDFIKEANKSYNLTADLLDVASGIALYEHKRKTVNMKDIKTAISVDSLLKKAFSRYI